MKNLLNYAISEYFVVYLFKILLICAHLFGNIINCWAFIMIDVNLWKLERNCYGIGHTCGGVHVNLTENNLKIDL